MPEEPENSDGGLRDAIHWLTLELRLPPEGVRKRFGSDEACRTRLAQVRWPAGPVCPRCSSPEVFELSTRVVFKCRSCKYQFSVTTGTAMHGSRIGLSLWFAATEAVIRSRSRGPKDYFVTGHALARLLGTPYETAWRAKSIVRKDVASDGPGLLRDSVCVTVVELPAAIPRNSEKHLDWLFDELKRANQETSVADEAGQPGEMGDVGEAGEPSI